MSQNTASPFECYYCSNRDPDILRCCTSRNCRLPNAYCSWCPTCKVPSPCRVDTHQSCWAEHLPRHPDKRLEHNPLPIRDQVLVSDILHEGVSNDAYKALHKRDRKAQWFIVDPNRSAGSRGVLFVTDRFESICARGDPGSRSAVAQFPILVSFIGTTASGKSSLIRALIKMPPVQGGLTFGDEVDCPVGHSQDQAYFARTTTAGVNLYKDPFSAAEKRPLIFADCEGFEADAAAPASLDRASHVEAEIGDYVQQKILIEAPSYSQNRSTGMANLYARFLYAFSDVVCFVIKNESQIQSEMRKLLEWASRSHRTSLNESPWRTLVVIINQLTTHHDSLMNEDEAAKVLFGNCGAVWSNSPELTEVWKEADRSGNRIATTHEFLARYFRVVRVCYTPHNSLARPDGLPKQWRLLRKMVTPNPNRVAETRIPNWMQRNIQDLSKLFPLAFEHFAKHDEPFDFYHAARKGDPRPREIDDHIMTLRRLLEDAEDPLLGRFPQIVASALLNDALRAGGLMRNPDDLWEGDSDDPTRGYKFVCDKGLTKFREEHARCEFVSQDGRRCSLRFGGHLNGNMHRDGNGADLQVGHFYPFNYGKEDVVQIGNEFYSQYRYIWRDPDNRPTPQRMTYYRQGILSGAGMEGSWKNVRSNKTCFACLREVPDHVLPCLHALCEPCVRDFGEESQHQVGEIVISSCPLCLDSWGDKPQLIQIKPPGAGVRLLTLDGGGIKGIVELIILQEIEKKIGLGLGIANFFDLVTGTSTGGIIALGLVMKELELADMRTLFHTIAENTFRSARGPGGMVQILSRTRAVRSILLWSGAWPSVYRTNPLKEALQQTFGNMTMFGAPGLMNSQRLTRVAVTAVKGSGSTSTIITNYNPRISAKLKTADLELIGESKSNYWNEIERAELDEDELKAWEAGLCTAAAPFYFKSFVKLTGSAGRGTEYWDGGITENNPVRVATKEFRGIWPGSHLDILVSIGTGVFEQSKKLPKVVRISALKVLFNSFLENANGEAIWGKFQDGRDWDRKTHHRLNLQFDGLSCGIDEWEKMAELELRLKQALQPPVERRPTALSSRAPTVLPNAPNASILYPDYRLRDEIDRIAQALVASLFFFEPRAWDTSGLERGNTMYNLHGAIMCRLRNGSTPLKLLVERIEEFRISESADGRFADGVPVTISNELKTAVRNRGSRFEIKYTIKSFDPSNKQQMIRVIFKEGFHDTGLNMPISGFPRTQNGSCLSLVIRSVG